VRQVREPVQRQAPTTDPFTSLTLFNFFFTL
jgi:hypothetical protein